MDIRSYEGPTSESIGFAPHVGATIDRVYAFNHYGIADLRSRICDVEKDYNIAVDRRVKAGKRYKEYFITNRQLNLL